MAGVGLEPRSPEPATFLQCRLLREVLTAQPVATLVESTSLATAPEETCVSVRTLRQIGCGGFSRPRLLSRGMAAALTARAVPMSCFIGSTVCIRPYLQHTYPSLSPRSLLPHRTVPAARPSTQLPVTGSDRWAWLPASLGELLSRSSLAALASVWWSWTPPLKSMFLEMCESSHGPSLCPNLGFPYGGTKTVHQGPAECVPRVPAGLHRAVVCQGSGLGQSLEGPIPWLNLGVFSRVGLERGGPGTSWPHLSSSPCPRSITGRCLLSLPRAGGDCGDGM